MPYRESLKSLEKLISLKKTIVLFYDLLILIQNSDLTNLSKNKNTKAIFIPGHTILIPGCVSGAI